MINPPCYGQVAAEREAAKHSGGESSAAAEVAGFNFQRLVERKPELKQELLTFKDHLLAFSSAEETLKVFTCISTPCHRLIKDLPWQHACG